MILKTLVTGVAAAAVVAAAAGGVTSIASGVSAAPAVTPVVWDVPMPAAPAPDLQGPLSQTINALGSGGSFSSKAPYLEPLPIGVRGRAEKKYNGAVAQGYFPLTANVAPDVDLNGNVATADVTATSANGTPAGPIQLTFAESPSSPTGWVLTIGSLLTLSSALG